MKPLSFLLLLHFTDALQGQNIHHDRIKLSLYQPPLHPLKIESKTFTVSVTDLSTELSREEMRKIEEAISINGYGRAFANPGLVIEIIVSPLTITDKELRDRPFKVDKDGTSTVYHNFYYLLSCSFPLKLRITLDNGEIIEQNLPAFFQTKYEGTGTKTEQEMQHKWEHDQHYRSVLFQNKVAEKINETNDFLSTHYGYGRAPHVISLGYVKSKKHDYSDVNMATAHIRTALSYAGSNDTYLNDSVFLDNIQKAVDILKRTLKEAVAHKRARINPKVAGMAHYNLAVASFIKRDFPEAERNLTLAGNSTIASAGASSDLLDKILDHKKRFAIHSEPAGATSSADQEVIKRMPKPSAKSYIVGLRNDTLEAELILPSSDDMLFGDTVWLQERIIVANRERPIELLPEQLTAFSFRGADYESLWWVDDVTTTPWTIARKFCKRIISGAIPVFSCNEVVTNREGFKMVRSNLYYKEQDEYKPASFLNFHRGVSKLVSANRGLSERVRSGQYTKDDFLLIVQEFNKQVEPKTSH